MAAGAEYQVVDDPRGALNARFHGPLMSFFLRRVKNRSEAEDLTQDVLVRVVAAGQPGRIKRADAFVFKVAANLLRDRYRQRTRRRCEVVVPIDPTQIDELENQLIEELSPERILLAEDMLEDVLRTLEELGERTRDIYVLFRLENMKQKDIAALCGIGTSTVEKHVMRATLHLTVRYGAHWLAACGSEAP